MAKKEAILSGVLQYAEQDLKPIFEDEKDTLATFIIATAIGYLRANPDAANKIFQSPLISAIFGPGPDYDAEGLLKAMEAAAGTAKGVPVPFTMPGWFTSRTNEITFHAADFRRIREYIEGGAK